MAAPTATNRKIQELREQRKVQKSRSDEELFIPFVDISAVEKRVNGSIAFLVDINSGSNDYKVVKTFKQFAQLDEAVCSCMYSFRGI
jgi:hypothetical protein